MYQPLRRSRWNEHSERLVAEKRAKLSDMGVVTDEQVCEWFRGQGIECEPADVHPMMMDAVSVSPFERVMASLADRD